jgi:anti-sigma factor RsiW
MTCPDTTLSLGVYLLGALDPSEQDAVERHLADCALCRAELAELAGLSSILEQVTLEDLEQVTLQPPDDLYERVAASARAEHAAADRSRMRRYRRLVAVAAAVVLITGASVGGWVASRGSDTPRSQVFHSKNGPVRMNVTLASETSGTGLAVSVSGLSTDEHCRLIAIAKDGSRDVAGRWDATYQGEANVTGSTSIQRSDLTRLVLLGTDGQRLATVVV